jgi:DNA-directed RNA polymerase specialized sigma24 family protein
MTVGDLAFGGSPFPFSSVARLAAFARRRRRFGACGPHRQNNRGKEDYVIHFFDYDPFKRRFAELDTVVSHTVACDLGGGPRLLIHSPFWSEELEESLLKVWRQLRELRVPQKEALYILLTLHPWCWEMWGEVARDVVPYHRRRACFDDVIDEAQTDLWQELCLDDDLWKAAVSRPAEAFPGWIVNVMTNRCRNVWDRYDRHLSGTKKKRREPFPEEAIGQIADTTDVVGAAVAKEFWEKVDASCPEPIRKMLRQYGLGFTIREIAASLQYSKSHVARAIKTEFERLRIDLKPFL